MGLILVASSAIWGRVTDARTLAEIRALSDACEAFKQRYGRYPPSRIVLKEKGEYDVRPGVGFVEGGQPGDVEPYDAKELKAIFSGIDLDLYTHSGGRDFHDWNGNGVADDEAFHLKGYQCLVYFLGGIPRRDPTTAVAMPSGFNPDKAYPTRTSPGARRDGPFFEFDPKRLFPAPNQGQGSPNSNTPHSFDIYLDTHGMPYAYYRAGKKHPALPVYEDFDGAWALTPQTGERETGRTAYYRKTPSGDQDWYNRASFQIISAGRDKKYGSGPWPRDPDVDNYHANLDNLTNFSDGRLQTLLK